MKIVEWIGIGLLVVLVLFALLFVRRSLIARLGGTIEVSLRLSTLLPGRGWSSGLGRFAGDELQWYRIFSLALRPRRVLHRQVLAVQGRRRPDGPERLALPADWMILSCNGPQQSIEIAMAESTLTGFLSWIEAAPPGAASMHLAAS
jgi:Protein of unknown function (DUF2550)